MTNMYRNKCKTYSFHGILNEDLKWIHSIIQIVICAKHEASKQQHHTVSSDDTTPCRSRGSPVSLRSQWGTHEKYASTQRFGNHLLVTYDFNNLVVCHRLSMGEECLAFAHVDDGVLLYIAVFNNCLTTVCGFQYPAASSP